MVTTVVSKTRTIFDKTKNISIYVCFTLKVHWETLSLPFSDKNADLLLSRVQNSCFISFMFDCFKIM